MNSINNLDSLNELFFSDKLQRKHYLDRTAALFDPIFVELNIKPGSKILALSRSWLSDLLIDRGEDVTVLPAQISSTNKYDLILALDEILTRESDEQSQKKLIVQILNLLSPDGILIATLRDYRNNNYHRRPLGDNIFAQIGRDRLVVTEVNDLDMNDKQRWNQKIHMVVNDQDFICIEAGYRRTLYFKQLAKYCNDSNIDKFGVFKDYFWRGHLRRSPEHIIYARAK